MEAEGPATASDGSAREGEAGAQWWLWNEAMVLTAAAAAPPWGDARAATMAAMPPMVLSRKESGVRRRHNILSR
uniref:Uncharacterized protein n=1 Tax=Arundo donax TaxID=35708 RepID=A0A0A9B8U2_ARUDO